MEYQVFLFDGQKVISEILVLIVVICVPIYLCTKPCLMMCQKHDDHAPEGQQFESIDANVDRDGGATQPLMEKA